PDDFLARLGRSPEIGRAVGELKPPGGTVSRETFLRTFPDMAREWALGVPGPGPDGPPPDPAAAAEVPAPDPGFWSALPPEHFAPRPGLVTARSDWGGSATVVSVRMGNLPDGGQQTMAPGQLEISRGADRLLIDTEAAFGPLGPTQRTRFSNMV